MQCGIVDTDLLKFGRLRLLSMISGVLIVAAGLARARGSLSGIRHCVGLCEYASG
ncbi:MAG: hypothetical protein ACETWE_02160 [Candidatus Bathyarchaeia archaeon]